MEAASDPLRHGRKELHAATKALDRMRVARSFDELEAAWNDCLTRLEKAWEKVNQACRHKSTKYQPWQGKYAGFRRKDPLLRYVHQARNADQHTLEESMAFQPGEYSFKLGKPGESVYIKELRTDARGRVSHYEGTAAPEVVDRPARIALRPVTNRGKRYNPPTQHQGLLLASADPISIAKLGIAFYESMLEDAATTFFPPSA